MQKCGQLQASMAVALIAQSTVGEEVWPADTPSRAMTISNGTLRIGVTSFSCGIIRQKMVLRKANRGSSSRQPEAEIGFFESEQKRMISKAGCCNLQSWLLQPAISLFDPGQSKGGG